MDLSDRMKQYEKSFASYLPPHFPVIMRIDGKAFHSYTRGLPFFHQPLVKAMNNAALRLCKEVVGARLAYVQSDEISLVINPWINYNSQPYFGNNIQKLVSVTASIASAIITSESENIFGSTKLAFFDSRAFILPECEINSYLLWRQLDNIRNSIQVLGRQYYSNKQLHKKSNTDIVEMLLSEENVSWEDQPNWFKLGRCIVYKDTKWEVLENTPAFLEDRSFSKTHCFPSREES